MAGPPFVLVVHASPTRCRRHARPFLPLSETTLHAASCVQMLAHEPEALDGAGHHLRGAEHTLKSGTIMKHKVRRGGRCGRHDGMW